jgi:hypothetical protein
MAGQAEQAREEKAQLSFGFVMQTSKDMKVKQFTRLGNSGIPGSTFVQAEKPTHLQHTDTLMN